jgi:hypothetical protein
MIAYKYAGEFGVPMLEGLRFKVTPPAELNDPFELTPRSVIADDYHISLLKGNPGEYRALYEKMCAAGKPVPPTFEQFIPILRACLEATAVTRHKMYRNVITEDDLKSPVYASGMMGLLCFSLTPLSLTMWAHYADCHKGIAIGVDTSHESFCGCCHQDTVKYRKHRYKIREPLSKESDWNTHCQNMVFTKSNHWNYEQEYRMVFRLNELSKRAQKGGALYFLHVDPHAVRQVILGCFIKPDREEQIRDLFRRRPRTYGHIELLRCERHKTQFALTLVSA